MPSFVSYECLVILWQLMTLKPSDRPALRNVMKEPWLNWKQEEELRPYLEPPCENMDPWVTQRMMEMGFQPENIEESVTSRTYDKQMGTYLILCTKKPKLQVRTIKVRPFPGSDLSSPRPPETRQLQLSDQEAEKPPVSSRVSLQSGDSIATHSPESGTRLPQASWESRPSSR